LYVGFSHFGLCPFQCLGLLRVQGLELLLLVEFLVLLLFWALLRLLQLFPFWRPCTLLVLQCSGFSIQVESSSCLGHWGQRLRFLGLLGLCLYLLYQLFVTWQSVLRP